MNTHRSSQEVAEEIYIRLVTIAASTLNYKIISDPTKVGKRDEEFQTIAQYANEAAKVWTSYINATPPK